MHVRHPPARLVAGDPVQLYVFDLLYHGEDSLLSLPYTSAGPGWKTSTWTRAGARTPPCDDAEAMLAASLANGLEGVVGKPLASRYHPGRRPDWIKVKNIWHQEVTIGGWQPGQGGRATFGSLLLGLYDDGHSADAAGLAPIRSVASYSSRRAIPSTVSGRPVLCLTCVSRQASTVPSNPPADSATMSATAACRP